VNRASSDRQRSQLRNKRKRRSQPVEENAEVIAGVGQDGSDRVALLPSEIVAARTVLVLDVANHGSMAERRLISRLMAGVIRRFWPACRP
jgi:hypothetical protein